MKSFGYDSSSKTLVNTWNVEDILSIRPEYTEEQCCNVLEMAEDRFDANLGFNWDFFEMICEEIDEIENG